MKLLRLRLSQSLDLTKAATLVSLPAMLVLAISAPLHAQAGSPADNQWGTPVQTGAGTASAISVNQWGYPNKISDGTVYPWEYDGPDNGILMGLHDNDEVNWGAASDQGIASSSAVDGMITETRQWIGIGPPPKTINVLEVSRVTAIGGYGNAGLGTATAINAFNDPMTPCSFGWNGMGVQSTGTRLVQVDSSSGIVSLSGHLNATANVSAFPGGDYIGSCGTVSYFDWYVDSRAVTISRDGAHGETVDPDGTVHGDTIYSYGSGNVVIYNAQLFHPYLSGGWTPNPNYISTGIGPLENISWQWDPSGQAPNFVDTWDSHGLNADIGKLYCNGFDAAGNPQWDGTPDAVEHIITTYTATDLKDNAQVTGTYDLQVHDQYDNWHRVDAQGNPMSGSASGDFGDLTQIGQATAERMDVPLVSIEDAGVDWNAVGIVGGGALSGTSVLLLGIPDPPVWPATVLGLIGLAITTKSSLPPPPPPPPVGPPDQINASFLQNAYQEYVYNKTAQPGEENNTNLVDTNFYGFLAKNPDFQGYDQGNYGTVSITATVYQQMLNYYFYANQYDRGGLVTTTASSTVHRPGGHVWRYLWTYAGSISVPSNPSL